MTTIIDAVHSRDSSIINAIIIIKLSNRILVIVAYLKLTIHVIIF